MAYRVKVLLVTRYLPAIEFHGLASSRVQNLGMLLTCLVVNQPQDRPSWLPYMRNQTEFFRLFKLERISLGVVRQMLDHRRISYV